MKKNGWEEREKENKKYYEDMLESQRNQQREEVNRLQNLINRQMEDNKIQINNL